MSPIRSLLRWLNRYKHHILIWILIWEILMFANPLEGDKVWTSTIALVIMLGYLAVFYLTSLFIYPLFRDGKKFESILLLLLQGAIYVGHLAALWFVVYPFLGLVDPRDYLSVQYIVYTSWIHYFFLVAAASVYFWHCNNRLKLAKSAELERKQLQLEKEKLESERELMEKEKTFLKNQFNEHTIFNFFNSLNRKVYRQVPEASEAISLFSDFLSYSLRLKFDTKVPLRKEIDFIKDYIEIQRILVKDLSLDYQEIGPIDHVNLPPYVLFPFIENAFKHGIVNDPNHPMKVKLDVNGKLAFEVSNQKGARRPNSPGVGFRNVKRMLDIYYPNQYDLSFNDDAEQYMVHLTINDV